MIFFPESFSNDVVGLDESNPNEGKLSSQRKVGSLFLLSSSLRKKADTKRNGIPKVISIVTQVHAKKVERPCCGPDFFRNQTSEHDTLYNPVSFDSSILRLEQELMRVNLEADVERKVENPQQTQPRLDTNQERTATAASVTSSISTRSSLKFGASIVKLPSAMEVPCALAEPE